MGIHVPIAPPRSMNMLTTRSTANGAAHRHTARHARFRRPASTATGMARTSASGAVQRALGRPVPSAPAEDTKNSHKRLKKQVPLSEQQLRWMKLCVSSIKNNVEHSFLNQLQTYCFLTHSQRTTEFAQRYVDLLHCRRSRRSCCSKLRFLGLMFIDIASLSNQDLDKTKSILSP